MPQTLFYEINKLQDERNITFHWNFPDYYWSLWKRHHERQIFFFILKNYIIPCLVTYETWNSIIFSPRIFTLMWSTFQSVERVWNWVWLLDFTRNAGAWTPVMLGKLIGCRRSTACTAFWFGGFVVDENSYLKASKLHDNMLFVSETVVKPLYAHTGKVTLVQ